MYTNSWVVSPTVKNGQMDAFPQPMVEQMIKAVGKYNEKQPDDYQIEYFINQKHIKLYGDEKAVYDTFKFSLESEDDVNGRLGIDSWRFCKTNREPYDVVIKVFLSLMKQYGLITSWDHGDNSKSVEYQRARRFAKKLGIEWHGSGSR